MNLRDVHPTFPRAFDDKSRLHDRGLVGLNVGKYPGTAVTAVRPIMGYGIPMMSKEERILCIGKGLYVSPGTRPK